MTDMPQRQLPKECLAEAQMLLTYAAQHGLEIDKNIVSTLVSAAHQAESGNWDAELETEFWMAFNQLAQLVKPVSVDSLKAASNFESKLLNAPPDNAFMALLIRFSRFLFGSHGYSHASITVSRYQRGTMFAMLLLLFTHAYWVVGSTIINYVGMELPTQIEQQENNIRALRKIANNTEDPQEAVDAQDRASILEAKVMGLEERIVANYDILVYWNSVWSFFLPGVRQDSVQNADFTTTLRYNLQAKEKAEFALQVIRLYVLPLLYGLLGASAYVLRMLTIEIRSLAYSVHSNIGYRLRIQLGAVSGLAIGWFSDSGQLETLGSLSWMALAFLAGYSVEVLFSLMDRLIYTFSQNSGDKFIGADKKPS
jgi:hypothetical protein